MAFKATAANAFYLAEWSSLVYLVEVCVEPDLHGG